MSKETKWGTRVKVGRGSVNLPFTWVSISRLRPKTFVPYFTVFAGATMAQRTEMNKYLSPYKDPYLLSQWTGITHSHLTPVLVPSLASQPSDSSDRFC